MPVKTQPISSQSCSLIIAPNLPSSIGMAASNFANLGNKVYMSMGSQRNFLHAIIDGQFYWKDWPRHKKIKDYMKEIGSPDGVILEKDEEANHICLGYTKEFFNFHEMGDFALYKPTLELNGTGHRVVITHVKKDILSSMQYEIWGDCTECFDMFYTDNPNQIILELKPTKDPEKHLIPGLEY